MKRFVIASLSASLVLTTGCLKEDAKTSATSSFKTSGSSFAALSETTEECTAPVPEFSGNLSVEAGQPANLTYTVPNNPRWVIFSPEGEMIFVGQTITVTFDQVGEYIGQAWGTDVCGKTYSQPFVLAVLPPMGTPQISINGGAETTSTASVTVTATATNAYEMYVTNDPSCEAGGTWQPITETLDWTLAGESTDARVYVRYRSPARTSECVSDGISYDDTAPTIEIVSAPEARSYQPSAAFEFRATDTVSGVKLFECSFQNEPFKECPLTFAHTNLTYGSYNVRVRATDNAGNVSSETQYSWEYLNTAPTVTITSSPGAVVDSRQAEFVFEGRDDAGAISFECQLDNSNSTSCQSPVSYGPLANGGHKFTVVAVDESGLRSEPAVHNWRVEIAEPPPRDPVPPVVRLVRTPESSTSTSSASFEFVATHSGAGIHHFVCQIDGLPEENCQSPALYQLLSVGPHRFSVYAVDNDQLRSTPVSFSWEIIKTRVPVQDVLTVDSQGRKLDVVIIVDNSGSMREEQKKMAKRFRTFLSRLSGLDWQLGIITTDAHDGARPGTDGRLVPFKGLHETFSINANTPNVDEIFSKTIVRKEIGASNEEGIRSFYKMLQRPENRFMIREQSHVASIVISDEDEKSHGKNLKTQNQPENLIATFNNLYGKTNSYSHHSIVLREGYNKKGCPQVGSNSFGKTYMRLSKLTDGIVGDICASDYGDILKGIGDMARERTFSAKLKCDPVGPVSVDLNPQQNVQHQLNGRELTFVTQPQFGTKVTITYYCE